MTISQRARRQRARRRRRVAASGGGLRISLWLLLFVGLFWVMLIATGAAATTGALYGKQKYDEFIAYVAPPDELLASLPRGGARIYDRNGVLLYEFVDEFGGLRRPVPIEEISDWLIAATIATEDASFYTNNGLNVRGLARAGIENFSPFGDSEFLEGTGGSSITQQLAKNIYIPKEQRTARTVERKLREAAIALELTERYTKDQILGWYLNSISYGGIYVGIQAASEGYFGKQASELTLAEAAADGRYPAVALALQPAGESHRRAHPPTRRAGPDGAARLDHPRRGRCGPRRATRLQGQPASTSRRRTSCSAASPRRSRCGSGNGPSTKTASR